MPLVGVPFVNPGSNSVSATFRLISPLGSTITTSSRSIGARGQVSFTLGQLFPGVTSAGYMTATIDSDLVTGFWLGGDFVTSTDGAPLLGGIEPWAYIDFTFL